MSDIRFLGSPYGGYHIDVSKITAKSVVYDFGVGMDASFALELAGVTGCKAFLFDPTPEVAPFIAQHEAAWLKANFAPWGIGVVNGMVPFYHHKEPSFITHSVQAGGSWLDKPIKQRAQLFTISMIMQQLKHKTVDYLKLNLGGDYEHDVILNILKRKVFPAQLAYIWVHMDARKKAATEDALKKAGYRKIATDDHKKVDLLCR